jgi:uncharacterized protein YceH (UPF0502 family)
MNDENSAAEEQPAEDQPKKPRWQPISSIDRRVLGVLAEKAKTTPDSYPMSLSLICTAANQKSNRSPVMNLDVDDLEESLERLREMGAVGLIEGYGRVSKYRHYLYEWLGVDKVELAIMAELLLRGDQTEGALRGRASRMEPIKDLGELRPLLASLKSKGLVVSLTPEGRGHVLTHGLYTPSEMQRLKATHASGHTATPPAAAPVAVASPPAAPSPMAAPSPTAQPQVAEALRGEIQDLRSQVSQLRNDVDDITTELRRTTDELNDLRNSLGG